MTAWCANGNHGKINKINTCFNTMGCRFEYYVFYTINYELQIKQIKHVHRV